jgi:hypothetical protein
MYAGKQSNSFFAIPITVIILDPHARGAGEVFDPYIRRKKPQKKK